MEHALDILRNALMITGFVFVMMLVIEYLNVLTSGNWQGRLAGHQWGQYLLAAALGALPGCLGPFAIVAMYTHRLISIGAVVTSMVATSGDEAFVMWAMIPRSTLFLTGALVGLGIAAGAVTDLIIGRRTTEKSVCCEGFVIHAEERAEVFARGRVLQQWKECIPARGILAAGLTALAVSFASGELGPPDWDWVRVSLLAVCLVALFIVSTVSDHFLTVHLWNHVSRTHVPRIFAWTLGALIATHLLIEQLNLGERIGDGKWQVLIVACLVGLIPESGPHLVFVTLFAEGAVPFGVLLASSVVQDGHGMLPLLAHSRRAFFAVKAVNLAVGLAAGAVLLIWERMAG